jgi:hypothetical protein
VLEFESMSYQKRFFRFQFGVLTLLILCSIGPPFVAWVHRHLVEPPPPSREQVLAKWKKIPRPGIGLPTLHNSTQSNISVEVRRTRSAVTGYTRFECKVCCDETVNIQWPLAKVIRSRREDAPFLIDVDSNGQICRVDTSR